jgi:uncharacterized protein (TIGR03118 family)
MSNLASRVKHLVTSTIAAGVLCAGAWRAEASPYVQTNLVSDISGFAILTDPELKNPWGMSKSATSPFWISNQGTNSSTLYSVTGDTIVSKVNINTPNGFVGIPTTATGPQGPTGQISNGNAASFPVGNGGNGGSARFIFADLNGTISAWDTGLSAFIQVTAPGALYTGLAVNAAQNRIYVANGASGGSIDVYNSGFAAVSLAGGFSDPHLPAGYVPFNIQDIGGKLYVTYAPAGRAAQSGATAGMGVVDVFDEDGNLLQTLISGSQLAAPWGMALAPAGFGQFGGDLLVGNFSFIASEINAFDPVTGALVGSIPIDTGINSPGGLWGIAFGNGAAGGSTNTLYFADGINGERDGLFGALSVGVPEPITLSIFGAGLTGAIAMRHRRKAMLA